MFQDHYQYLLQAHKWLEEILKLLFGGASPWLAQRHVKEILCPKQSYVQRGRLVHHEQMNFLRHHLECQH